MSLAVIYVSLVTINQYYRSSILLRRKSNNISKILKVELETRKTSAVAVEHNVTATHVFSTIDSTLYPVLSTVTNRSTTVETTKEAFTIRKVEWGDCSADADNCISVEDCAKNMPNCNYCKIYVAERSKPKCREYDLSAIV